MERFYILPLQRRKSQWLLRCAGAKKRGQTGAFPVSAALRGAGWKVHAKMHIHALHWQTVVYPGEQQEGEQA
ncbi:MAG: hypothetical protein LBS96_09200 [Oscillospiraceae bacterium]|nr:hypothetical protein [Oscillospiraceae bacterium]